jgi:hypothetical protein
LERLFVSESSPYGETQNRPSAKSKIEKREMFGVVLWQA